MGTSFTSTTSATDSSSSSIAGFPSSSTASYPVFPLSLRFSKSTGSDSDSVLCSDGEKKMVLTNSSIHETEVQFNADGSCVVKVVFIVPSSGSITEMGPLSTASGSGRTYPHTYGHTYGSAEPIATPAPKRTNTNTKLEKRLKLLRKENKKEWGDK